MDDETDKSMIILFAYSLVQKLAVSVSFRPNRVRKLKKNCSAECSRLSLTANIFIFIFNAPAYQQASTYHLNMGLSKKRKQQLSYITARSLESRKHRKVVDYENQRKKEILRTQREEEDYWDEYEDFSLDSSSEESDGNESSPDQPSSDGEEEKVIEDSKRGEDIREGLGDDEGGVQLEIEERIFEPKWKSDAGGYLRGVRGCGSSATETREKRRKKELEKSASHTRSIRDMFSAQHNRNRLHHLASLPIPLLPPSLPEIPLHLVVKKMETKFELQTRAVHDLEELLRFKSQQRDKYGHELSHRSSYYRRHQMVRSFLWMQLNKEKDNPQCDRQALAQMVAQSFNKRKYTGRKVVQWERSWMKFRVIPTTEAGHKKRDLSWMEDEDLVLSIKDWTKRTGESK